MHKVSNIYTKFADSLYRIKFIYCIKPTRTDEYPSVLSLLSYVVLTSLFFATDLVTVYYHSVDVLI